VTGRRRDCWFCGKRRAANAYQRCRDCGREARQEWQPVPGELEVVDEYTVPGPGGTRDLVQVFRVAKELEP
jgi:hypothetical protein